MKAVVVVVVDDVAVVVAVVGIGQRFSCDFVPVPIVIVPPLHAVIDSVVPTTVVVA